ncbi:MAG: SCF ubiquitin ligase complex subunit cdc4 [Caeruleum heppii]|nr:MAG: SCF ubiquitin ligase complex subunit cdc4 [Caeruleum heppii]
MDPPLRPSRPKQTLSARPKRPSKLCSPAGSSPPAYASLDRYPTDAGQPAEGYQAMSRLRHSGGFSGSPHATLGQFSYAPATKTTVITTTTTTTTAFPPFLLKSPRHLEALDPKQYPLAASPTPKTLKNLSFDLAGTPTHFREADTFSQDELIDRPSSRGASYGDMQPVADLDLQNANKLPNTVCGLAPISGLREQPAPRNKRRKRPSSPVSISEAAGIAKLQREASGLQQESKPVLPFLRSSSRRYRSASSHSATFSADTPATPGTPNDSSSSVLRPRWAIQDEESVLRPRSRPRLCSPEADSQDTPSTLSPLSGLSNRGSFGEHQSEDHYACDGGSLEEPIARRDLHTNPMDLASATPPIAETDLQPVEKPSVVHAPGRPTPLTGLGETSTGHAISLPSPSLSPVTAALQYGDQGDLSTVRAENEDIESGFMLPPPTCNRGRSFATASGLAHAKGKEKMEQGRPNEPYFSNQQSASPTLMEIPTMLDSFDAMPPEMQTYVMYQFLRRSAKPTLQFVAAVVNPALKCDFLALLPLELSLNIVRNLDLQSLCRASQVSKKWRHITNSDEKAWKQLFDQAGFALPEGELQRAIREGWGWQHAHGSSDFEQDLSSPQSLRWVKGDSPDSLEPLGKTALIPGPNMVVFAPVDDPPLLSSSPKGRPKRKAAPKYPSRKSAKKRELSSRLQEKHISDDWMSELSLAEGPYAAATAAAVAVPNVCVGLPGLKNLHLYKSLYHRQHAIRKYWMQEEIKPRHIALRAHQGHVVTCLQFDGDKILTGSDDSNINVFDTSTGALRGRLKGHEGGVWALQYEGNVLVSGSTDRSVRVWDIERFICTQIFLGHTSTVRCLQILLPQRVGRTKHGEPIMMPKQPLIITGSRDSTLRVWKLPPQGKCAPVTPVTPATDGESPYFVRTLAGHIQSVRAIAAYADTLVSGSYDSTVRVWKISTGETLHRLQGHAQKVYSVVLDHRRNRCISGSMDNMVKVWSLESGTVLYNLEGHTSLVGLLDLSDDRLVSAAADSTLRIWDPEDGHCKSTLSAHTGAITCFQHDGQKVISGSDRTLKMWDVRTGECVRDLLTGLSGVWQVKFNERRCVAAVQRNDLTYIEVLDFGACRDGVPPEERGRRIVVNVNGFEMPDAIDAEAEVVVELG